MGGGSPDEYENMVKKLIHRIPEQVRISGKTLIPAVSLRRLP